MFKKKQLWAKPFSEKIAKRVKKVPTGELSMWVDQAMIDLGRCLHQYEKNRDVKMYLDEALVGAEAIHAMVDELHTRMTKV